MHYVVTIKVYKEVADEINKSWYRVQNSKEVMDLNIYSGDVMNIDGIGRLEVLGVQYKSRENCKNPYKSLELTCGMFH